MIRIGNGLCCAFIRFNSSIPSIPGIRTSERTQPKVRPGRASRKACASSNSVTPKPAESSRKFSESRIAASSSMT